jgi:hypothetical protein
MTFYTSRSNHKFEVLVRQGHSQDLFYGDKGEWTRDNRIDVKVGYFCALILCAPRKSELLLRFSSGLHDNEME